MISGIELTGAARISRRFSREWIETLILLAFAIIGIVSPGDLAGSGLKLPTEMWEPGMPDVSPGDLAGSGLKHRVEQRGEESADSISRRFSREWIETAASRRSARR